MCRIFLLLIPVVLQNCTHLFLCFPVISGPQWMAGCTGDELVQEMMGFFHLYFWSNFCWCIQICSNLIVCLLTNHYATLGIKFHTM